jgi:lipid-binding SYLF domain-containing protein
MRSLRSLILLVLFISLTGRAQATEQQLDRDAAAALSALYAGSRAARALGAKAKGVLVFPDARESSFVEGAIAGDGVLFRDGTVADHYNIGSLEADLEAGAQSYSYALFFMSDAALENLSDSLDFDISLDPDVVLVYLGGATELPAATAQPY